MDKITEALGKILPEDQISEVSKAVEEMMAEAQKELEAQYNTQLEEAYQQLAEERKQDEQVAEEGYQQAYEIIGSLMARIDEQRQEFETTLEEGFEEAYQEIEKAKNQNSNVEVEIYNEFDKKLKDMKEFMVDKVDQFLGLQEQEMYESARRTVLNDPTIAEQRVAVNKMAELLANYMDRDDLDGLTASKLEEAHKSIDDLKGQIRIVEARNVKLSANNTKLEEQVREAEEIITEATKNGKKERAQKAKNVSGRGQRVSNDDQIISEYSSEATKTDDQDQNLTEGNDELGDLLTLSGIE